VGQRARETPPAGVSSVGNRRLGDRLRSRYHPVRSEAESQVLDTPALRMREATIAVALPLTCGVSGLGGLYVWLTRSQPNRPELALLFLVSAMSAVGFYKLRRQIVRSRLREAIFLAWTLGDFVMLVTGTLADGGIRSPLIVIFFIPVVFCAMSYPLASVVAVGGVSILSYLAVALASGGASVGYQVAFAFTLLCTAAMSAWQARNHKRQHDALATASRTDPLTGCLNRRGYEERAVAQISALGRGGLGGAVVVLDIDNFKPVNDLYGHAAGDELLCWVVETLTASLRAGDSIGRLGGDEFAVLLPETDADSARASATRIAEALAERAPVSLGVALYPDDGQDLETLTRRADARLYATRTGRYQRQQGADSETAAVYDPEAGPPARAAATFGPIDLWRAAREAMPSHRRQRDDPRDAGLQSALLDDIDASVIATDMLGNIISWNSGAEAIYGWTREEAVGRSARELVVPEDPADAERLREELNRDGRWDGELLVRRKDGSLFNAYVRNRLVLDNDGAPSAIVGVAVDISARVAAETELLHSRNYAQAVTEYMGEGLFTVDRDGRIAYVNRAAEALLGATEGELHGRDVVDAVYLPGPDGSTRAFADCPIWRALHREVTVRVEEERFARLDGGELQVAYTATPFRTDEGLQGCVVIFGDISERKDREEESRRNAETLAVIDRVEDALANGRFVLHAQPIVDLRTGETVQHELLLRMIEPDGRVIAPADFLPVCEQKATIGEIDWWVIREAARLAGEGTPVQLNISARSVGDPDVLEHIERCIEQFGVAPGTMVFEITETAVAGDEDAARAFVEGLHRLGCKVALDDFGTGYGTLTYLKQLPVDHLKLDIEFVRDLVQSQASRHVVEAVIALARDFHLETVGEGVEDAATLELLRELGVDYAQGFHLAGPEPFLERPGDSREPVRIGTGGATPQPPERRGQPAAPSGSPGAGGALTLG
jgi:diguanylate cyclase (GGDEF)-like protein/PAS domain S-box-containing protein